MYIIIRHITGVRYRNRITEDLLEVGFFLPAEGNVFRDNYCNYNDNHLDLRKYRIHALLGRYTIL